MPNVVCENCGGTDFYNEAGFYYCNECQIQSQDIREQVFDNVGDLQKKSSRKIQSDKSSKTDKKITSWECYNYVVLGLTHELINLGADKQLKSVIRILWLRYLEKIEAFNRQKSDAPKLQLEIRSDRDCEILEGRKRKHKRKKSSKSSSEAGSTSLDASSIRFERAKKKRALVKAHYDKLTQESEATSSLHNETLTSLGSESDQSSVKSVESKFNKFARAEIRKSQSQGHRRKHKLDPDLECHKPRRRHTSNAYNKGMFVLSINKMYEIIYLGLLIVRDQIQLSDMIRFLKESHLSFNRYYHLFPEDFADKTINFRNNHRNEMFSVGEFRKDVPKMAKFLSVSAHVETPEFNELARRYCKELNLPEEIYFCVENIITRTNIKMKFSKYWEQSPNYEGRILSVIMFVLKLIFGLDGATETHLGNYSHDLNQEQPEEVSYFNIIDWLKHLEYRNLIINHFHCPSNYTSEEGINNLSSYLDTLTKKTFTEPKPNNFIQLLTNLKDQVPTLQGVDFPPTLTPFLEYNRILLEHKEVKNNYLTEILKQDFSEYSLKHLLNPNPFLKFMNGGAMPRVINGGAQEDWVLEKNNEEAPEIIAVKLSLEENEPNSLLLDEENNVELLKENFECNNRSCFEENAKKLESLGEKLVFNNQRVQKYSLHYNPYERYWIRFVKGRRIGCPKWKQILEELPFSFRLVFKECQRIAQQSEKDLMEELQFTEIYLAFQADFKFSKSDVKKPIEDADIRGYLKRLEHFW